MKRYLLSSTCGESAYLDVELEKITKFPLDLSGEKLLEKVIDAVGTERARSYCFQAWTGMLSITSVSTYGGYSSEPGKFVGYTKGEVRSSGGPACLWGDSDSPTAEFTYVKGSSRKATFAVCCTNEGRFWLHQIYDNDHLKLAEALGVEIEDLMIA